MIPSEKLTLKLIEEIERKRNDRNLPFNLAISGGSSPAALFELWKGKYRDAVDWRNLRLFWVDERCVPADNPESNFGEARRLFIDEVPLISENVFPINGAVNPSIEAKRYELQVMEKIFPDNGFDMVILGIGEDGHTSSIFPGQEELLHTARMYLESVNPYSLQKRIALTASGILKSKTIIFYLRGEGKRDIIEKMAEATLITQYPAGFVIGNHNNTFIYWDGIQTIVDFKFNSIFADKLSNSIT